jgi:hypothetical protein
MNSSAEEGFTYTVEVIHPNGTRSQREVVHNLVPTEGLNHMMSVTFKGATPASSWFLGVYEGNYTPTSSITAATIAATATESTAYASATRVPCLFGAVTSGAVDNSASPALFAMTADKTLYGGFMVSSSTKAGASGVLTSAVRFSSPKVLENGDTLSVIAGNTLTSA